MVAFRRVPQLPWVPPSPSGKPTPRRCTDNSSPTGTGCGPAPPRINRLTNTVRPRSMQRDAGRRGWTLGCSGDAR